jgi:glycosyltransferase involved in cell wall biosynthesis
VSGTDLVSIVIPVYRDAERAHRAVEAILSQTLPRQTSMEIIVVDDGSGDGTSERLSQLDDPRVRLLVLPENVGRSAARNTGALAAHGTTLVFMDCDCLPEGDHFVTAHLHALKNAVASTGHVTGSGKDFWGRYQRDASIRRQRQHANSMVYAGSSQNLAVRSAAFTDVGGFDTGYRQYGFEDRDLLIRLSQMGPVAWADAKVHHMDVLTLCEVSQKMMVSSHSSARFAKKHPDAYRALGYAAMDAREHSWLNPLGTMIAPIVRPIATAIDRSEMLERLPYPAARALAKIVCGTAYLAGTSEHRSRSPLSDADNH